MISFDMPKGGMFLWARFRQQFDATEWLKTTLKQGVVFVPENTSSLKNRIALPSVCRLPRQPNNRCKRPSPACVAHCNLSAAVG